MAKNPTFTQAAILPKPELAKTSWWLNCDRETFREKQRIAQQRMSGEWQATNYAKQQSKLDT